MVRLFRDRFSAACIIATAESRADRFSVRTGRAARAVDAVIRQPVERVVAEVLRDVVERVGPLHEVGVRGNATAVSVFSYSQIRPDSALRD